MADGGANTGADAWPAPLAQAVADALESHLAILDDQGVIVAVNRAWRVFGSENEARMSGVLPGVSYLGVCDAAAAAGVAEAAQAGAAIRAMLAGERERFEIEYACHSPRQQRWFLLRVTRLPDATGPGRLVAAHEDITARMRTELALRDSEKRYSAWAQSSSDMICRHAPDGTFVYVSPACRTILGYEPDELLGRSPYELFHPDDIERLHQSHESVLDRDFIDTIPFRILGKDGRYRWVESTSVSVRDAAGVIVEIHTATRDIEARRQQEVALRRIEAAIEHVHDGVVITDAQLERPGPRIVYANPATCAITGYTLEELLGQTPRILQGPKTDRATLDRLKRQLAAGEVFSGQTVNYRKDGSEFLVEWQAAPVRDEQGRIINFVSIQRDITEKTRLLEEARRREAELAHVARLSTMGEMASGLAHELNQPLAAVVNFTQGCLRRMQRGEWEREALTDAMRQASDQAARASQIIRRVRQFIRKRGPHVGPAAVCELIDDAAALLAHDLRREQVRLVIDCPADLPALHVDAIQIVQVLVNLMRNAMEAMRNHANAAAKLLTVRATAHGQEVTITISDTGPGLDDATRARLFEPFFSTKADGMGLGLSISRSIIESHGGRLTPAPGSAPAPGSVPAPASTQRHAGATFTITLPLRPHANTPDP